MPKGEREKPGLLGVVIRPIVNSPELSEKIGYLVSQQRRAYNQSVEWLNREPSLRLMKSGGDSTPRHRSLQGRISELRDPKSPKYEPSWTEAPRWVHNAGAKLAHLAQQRFAADRQARRNEIRRIENKRHKWAEKWFERGQNLSPRDWKRLNSEERQYERLTRVHRRTLDFRTRKRGTQTLEVDYNPGFSVTSDRMSLWLGTERSGGFRVPLRRPFPKGAEVRSFRLVEKRKGRMGIANRSMSEVEYEAHIAVEYPQQVAQVTPDKLQEIVGVDAGVKKPWATSDGVFYENNSSHACQCPPPAIRDDGRRGQFRHQGRCVFARPQQLQTKIVKKIGGSARRRTSKRRRKLERRRRELLRMRAADRDRVFNDHARNLLDKRTAQVRMVAVEGLKRRNMMSTAKGGANAPGRNVRQKAGLNRSMSEAATGVTAAILARQCAKRGIPFVEVDPRKTSQTCSKCGNVSSKSRKNQARFECVACGWCGNADINASAVIQFRAYQQWVDPVAVLGLPPSGGPEQSSAEYQIRLL